MLGVLCDSVVSTAFLARPANSPAARRKSRPPANSSQIFPQDSPRQLRKPLVRPRREHSRLTPPSDLRKNPKPGDALEGPSRFLTPAMAWDRRGGGAPAVECFFEREPDGPETTPPCLPFGSPVRRKSTDECRFCAFDGDAAGTSRLRMRHVRPGPGRDVRFVLSRIVLRSVPRSFRGPLQHLRPDLRSRLRGLQAGVHHADLQHVRHLQLLRSLGLQVHQPVSPKLRVRPGLRLVRSPGVLDVLDLRNRRSSSRLSGRSRCSGARAGSAPHEDARGDPACDAGSDADAAPRQSDSRCGAGSGRRSAAGQGSGPGSAADSGPGPQGRESADRIEPVSARGSDLCADDRQSSAAAGRSGSEQSPQPVLIEDPIGPRHSTCWGA